VTKKTKKSNFILIKNISMRNIWSPSFYFNCFRDFDFKFC